VNWKIIAAVALAGAVAALLLFYDTPSMRGARGVATVRLLNESAARVTDIRLEVKRYFGGRCAPDDNITGKVESLDPGEDTEICVRADCVIINDMSYSIDGKTRTWEGRTRAFSGEACRLTFRLSPWGNTTRILVSASPDTSDLIKYRGMPQ
jgi:hypothetical protein